MARDEWSIKKTSIIQRLRSLGVVRCFLTYSGSGDEGYVDDCVAVNATYDPNMAIRESQTVKLDNDFEGEIKDWVMDLSEQEHGGWWNDDGGRGEVTIIVNASRVEWEHYDYFTDSTYSQGNR